MPAVEALIRLGREKRLTDRRAKKAKARMEKARLRSQHNRDVAKAAMAAKEAAATD